MDKKFSILRKSLLNRNGSLLMKEKCVLGIDIGGTNTVFGLVDREGNILFKNSIPTQGEEPFASLMERLNAVLEVELEKLSGKYDLAGVGIGAPNANYFSGTINNPPNLSWGEVSPGEIIREYFDVPVAITNDANAAVLGELYFGAAVGMKNFIEITLGTGLGSGIVVDGKVLYGANGIAGEMGHVKAVPNGRECACGGKGCLETYVSAAGIKRTAFELLASSNSESILRNKGYNDLTSSMVYEAALKGDEIARQAFTYTGEILGKALADTVLLFNPEAVIFAGGLSGAGELLIRPAEESMKRNLMQNFVNSVRLLTSSLSDGDAAILGAAALIWDEKAVQ